MGKPGVMNQIPAVKGRFFPTAIDFKGERRRRKKKILSKKKRIIYPGLDR